MTAVQDTTRRATRRKWLVTGLVILHTVLLGGCNAVGVGLERSSVSTPEPILTRMTLYEGALPILATWVAVVILWRWERIGYAILVLEGFLLPLYYQASKTLIFDQKWTHLYVLLDWFSMMALLLLLPGILLLRMRRASRTSGTSQDSA